VLGTVQIGVWSISARLDVLPSAVTFLLVIRGAWPLHDLKNVRKRKEETWKTEE
jgi:hypothetical protein